MRWAGVHDDVPTDTADRMAMDTRWPAGGRAAVFGAMLVLVALAVLGEAMTGTTRPWLIVADGVVGVVGSAVLVLQGPGRVRPALGLILVSGLSPAAAPLAATGTLWVARWQPLRVATGVAAAGVTAFVARGVWRPTSGIELGWWVVLVLAVHAALVGWGAMLRAHHRLVASLADRARRAEADQAARILEARRAERDRMAREMHDVLAHRLSLLSTYAGALEYRSDAPPDRVRKASAVIRAAAHQALEDLREVIGVLRRDDGGASPRRPLETVRDLPALVAECRDAGMAVSVLDEVDEAELGTLPAVTSRTAYRIVQEALTNVRRHAAGAAIELRLSGGPGEELVVGVTNGPAPTPAVSAMPPGSGTGLVGLGERVALANGQLRHGTTVEGGYCVEAHLPWPT